MLWEWLSAHFLTVVLPVGLAVLGIGATIWGVIYTLQRGDRANRQLQREIKKLQEQQTQTNLYLDGIPEIRNYKKALIYRDAFRAVRKYKHAEAIKKFQEALPLASDDSERCAILNLIGLSQMDMGATHDAEQTFLEMIRIAGQAKLDEPLAAAYGNIGLVFRTLGEPQKALEYYEKALKLNEQIGRLEGQANQLGNIGLAYFDLGDYQQALDYFQSAREIFVKIGAKDGIKLCDTIIALARQKLAGQENPPTQPPPRSGEGRKECN